MAISKTSFKCPVSTESGSTTQPCSRVIVTHWRLTVSQCYLLTVSWLYKKIKGDYPELSVPYNFLTVNSTPYLSSAPLLTCLVTCLPTSLKSWPQYPTAPALPQDPRTSFYLHHLKKLCQNVPNVQFTVFTMFECIRQVHCLHHFILHIKLLSPQVLMAGMQLSDCRAAMPS